MRNRSKAELDAEFFAEDMEFPGGEVAPVVGENAVRDAEATGDAFEELDGRGSRLVGDRNGFYPFGEFVDSHQEVCVPTRRGFRQGTNLIESPLGERPGEGYRH